MYLPLAVNKQCFLIMLDTCNSSTAININSAQTNFNQLSLNKFMERMSHPSVLL